MQRCHWRLRVLAALLVLVLVSAKHTHQIVGKVIGVSDGDTITVLDENKDQHKIRLEGIDAPESSQAFGTKAKQALSGKVFGKTVTIKWAEKDRYGRVLGDVFQEDRLVNKELVEEGWAWHFKKYSSSTELADAEIRARKASIGLWADKAPVAPWDFRNPVGNTDSGSKADNAGSSPSSPPKEAPQEVTVYVTKTGNKYHTSSCRHLSKSKIPISLDAARKTYAACSVCKPPN